MKITIFIQSVLIVFLSGAFYIQYTANLNLYSGLIKTLREHRAKNFKACFGPEIRHQDSYCWTYDQIDVILHFEGLNTSGGNKNEVLN